LEQQQHQDSPLLLFSEDDEEGTTTVAAEINKISAVADDEPITIISFNVLNGFFHIKAGKRTIHLIPDPLNNRISSAID
jgi:hypothetical protein